MSYPIPKIQYDPGTGLVTLPFTYPPINKSMVRDLVPMRTDSFSISGLKQTIYQRTDEILPLQIDFVPLSDLTSWNAFMHYALQGGKFNYFPDGTLSGFTTYTLDDTEWRPKRNFYGIDKFTLTMRRVIGPDQSGS